MIVAGIVGSILTCIMNGMFAATVFDVVSKDLHGDVGCALTFRKHVQGLIEVDANTGHKH
jgi:hypothetical protein